MAVTFEEAVRRAVKAYYEGSQFEAYEKVRGKPSKYKFDALDEVQKSYKGKYEKLAPGLEESDEEVEIAEEVEE